MIGALTLSKKNSIVEREKMYLLSFNNKLNRIFLEKVSLIFVVF
jgi:hypothetical protein